MQVTTTGMINADEQLLLEAFDELMVEGRIVPYQLLKHTLTEQMNSDVYETAVDALVEKGLIELAYSEGFDLGIRRTDSLNPLD